MGPNTANGKELINTSVTMGPRCLFGTSSPSTMPKDNWPAAATPLQALAAIRVSMVCAVPPTMLPTILSIVVPMTIHLRPKMSDRRPTSRKPTADPRIQTVPTQPRLGEADVLVDQRPATVVSIGGVGVVVGRMANSVFAGNTQPRYAQILPVHTAITVPMN